MLCLLKLLEEKSIDKITVKDICERCEINRNTFYYYFSDIYEVLEAMIEYETEQSLKEEDAQASFYGTSAEVSSGSRLQESNLTFI